MTKQSLGAFIKILQQYPENTYFQCPKDIFCLSSEVVTRAEARRRLALIEYHWKTIEGIETKFHIWGEDESTFWDKDNLRHIPVHVIKISADNEKIQEFASSMNTVGD